MSGRLLRFICTTALATVVVGATPALAVPVGLGSPVPEPGPAASPAPTGPAAPSGSATPAAPGATGPVQGEPAPKDPALSDPGAAPAAAPAAPSTPAEATLTRLRTLYQQSEQAGQTYRATTEALKRQQTKAKSVGAGLVKARMELAQSRNAAGRLAREQYQEQSGLSPIWT